MKVLLVNPSNILQDSSRVFRKIFPPVPPLSLMILGAALEKEKHSVTLFDMFVPRQTKKELFKLLEGNSFELVGFSVLTSGFKQSSQISREIKERFPHIKIVWGNIHASFFAEQLVREEAIDFVLKGEGEISLPLLCSSLELDKDLSLVPGLVFMKGSELCLGGANIPSLPLDELSYPAAHLLNFDDYRHFPLFSIFNKRFTLVSASRGCPYRCYFCAQDVMVQIPRYRSVNLLLDEMEFMYESQGIERFIFADAFFPFSIKEGLAFCEELMARGLHKKIKWITETRIDRVNSELLFKMKEAGLEYIMYGLETGSQRTLDDTHKAFDISQAELIVRETKRAKIKVIGLFVLGFPWETREDCLETLAFAKKLDCDIAKFNTLIPYPGTPYYKDYFKKLKIDTDEFNTWLSTVSVGKKKALPSIGKLSTEEINRLQRHAMLSYYLRPQILINLLLKGIVNFTNLFWGACWLMQMLFMNLGKKK